ncbi:MAG: histidine--tRNA ligase [Spirochaetales bacterium]|nr:histidine--tRNA ligase [Spirochaetales bacterium]
MKSPIEPKLLKGFRDFLPESEIVRKSMTRKLETVFEQFGFVPIDTPAIEYAEILLGKSGGETEKQIYSWRDQGGRRVALRFDLTVPFARFLAQHRPRLVFPFKRYHIAKVWRGENPQAGRYREFMQCDFDIVGADSVSADAEILLVVCRSFKSLRIEDFKIHVSHRGALNDFLSSLGIADRSADILRLVDKSRKIGPEKTSSELAALIGPEKTDSILDFISFVDSNELALQKMAGILGEDNSHVGRLRDVYACFRELGMAHYLVFDPSITRGLDYYTALVFETFVAGAEGMGSVCSGGRYDNLVSVYSKEKLSGIGGSVGIDRLLAVIEELGELPSWKGKTQIVIPVVDEDLARYYHKLAEMLRSEGFNVEVFHEKLKLAAQFTLAEKKGIPCAVIVGGRERERNVVQVRDFATRSNFENLSVPEAIVKLKGILQV